MELDNKYPLKVYKYRSWHGDNHKNLLLKNQLFFTSPKDFNDPFDSKIPHDYSLIDTDEKMETFISAKRIELKNHGSTKERTPEAIEELLDTFKYRLRNELDKVQEEYNALYFAGGDEHYGVLSLSERWDSILMWSHYADDHKGYCVGFWEEKMRNGIIATGGRAIYDPENNFPRLSPIGDFLENMIRQSHSKSNEWKYEKEYRLVKTFYPDIPSDEDRIQTFSNEYISEIIIGLSASQKTAQN